MKNPDKCPSGGMVVKATGTEQTPDQQEEEFYDGYEDYDDEEDRTCPTCNGTGGDPMNDGIMPCEDCDGEGYKWWL